MEKVRIYYDRRGRTMTVWFDDPKKESVCEEVDDDVILMKDRRGRVIGFEQLNYERKKGTRSTTTSASTRARRPSPT